MKRLIACLLSLFLLLGAACAAEVVGITGEFGDDMIYRYVAPNGQEIYYVSTSEHGGNVRMEDVNFDGADDIVVLYALGASNVWNEFYIWDGSAYVLAKHVSFSGGLANYTLHPEQKLVSVGASNGLAGALFQKAIFRWDGAEMQCVRYAESDYEKTYTFEGDLYTTVENYSVVHMRMYDARYSEAEGRQDVLIWEKKIPIEALNEQSFQELDDAFWNGLR